MFGSPNSERMQQLFADQFTRDGDAYLYRRAMRGPAYRVTAAERDAWIDAYGRSWRHLYLSAMAGTFVLIGFIVALAISRDVDPGNPALYLPLILLIAGLTIANTRVYGAPARALARRTPVAQGLSPADGRRLALERMSWGALGGPLIGLAVLLFRYGSKPHPLSGANLVWLSLCSAVLVGLIVRAVQKWRLGGAG